MDDDGLDRDRAVAALSVAGGWLWSADFADGVGELDLDFTVAYAMTYAI